jgi:hypothetical protein
VANNYSKVIGSDFWIPLPFSLITTSKYVTGKESLSEISMASFLNDIKFGQKLHFDIELNKKLQLPFS